MQSWDVMEEAGELTRRGQPFALATVVWRQGPSTGQQGSRGCCCSAPLSSLPAKPRPTGRCRTG